MKLLIMELTTESLSHSLEINVHKIWRDCNVFLLSVISLSDLHRLLMTIWGINASHAMENAPSPPTTWIKLDAGDVLSLRRLGPALVAVTEKER